jgi:hypothetical protein
LVIDVLLQRNLGYISLALGLQLQFFHLGEHF